MKKRQNESARAFALRAALSIALVTVSAILLASSFKAAPSQGSGAQPGLQQPDVVRMIGPVSQDEDLRSLPAIAANPEREGPRLMRHPLSGEPLSPLASLYLPIVRQPTNFVTMPSATLTFEGMDSNLACGTCLPPDTDGDVGP